MNSRTGNHTNPSSRRSPVTSSYGSPAQSMLQVSQNLTHGTWKVRLITLAVVLVVGFIKMMLIS